MENSSQVKYYRSLHADPAISRMLLFDNAIQLYDESGNNFVAAFTYPEISCIDRPGDYVRFSLLKNKSQLLDVPANHFLLPELLEKTGKSGLKGINALKRLKLPLIAFAFLLLLVFGYYVFVASVARFGVQFISPKKEAELGQLMFNTMMEEEKIDTALTRAVQEFAAPLQLSEQYKIKITVVDEKEVNAFAIPGGHIIIFRGILEKLKRPEELVALLGHESTHVNERHSLRNILQELSGSMLLSMVFGNLGSIGHTIASQANMLRGLSYSRGLEEEADEQGMQLMLSNKVNPKGMVFLMDRMKEAETDPKIPGFLSTHPVTSSRKEHALKFVAAHPVKEMQREDLNISWRALQQVIADSGDW
jgi:Zn-dependent protease with chaperone function